MRGIPLTLLLLLMPGLAHAQPEEPELPDGVYAVLEGSRGAPLLVLRARTDPAWGRGPLRLTKREWPTTVTRAVRLGGLPAEVRGHTRGTVTLYRSGLRACTARIGRPRLLRHVTPDFQYPVWNGEEGDPRLSDAQVARRAWDIAEGSELLVARAIPIRGRCQGAAWASRGAVRFGVGTPADPELIAAFRALPEYQPLAEAWLEAREYDADPAAEHWDARSAGAARRAISYAAGGRRFTLLVAEAHDLCGDFTGALWSLYEHTPAGLALVRAERVWHVPYGLADFDGDGVPEILSALRVTSASGVSVDVAAPFLGCPC